MSLGASRRAHLALLLTYVTGIAALGTAVTLAARLGIGAIHLERYLPSAQVVAVGEVALGVVLVIAAVVLARRPGRPRADRTRRIPVTPVGLAAAGAALAASLVVDPGFLVLVAVCALHDPWTYPAAFVYWGLWSQILMVGLCAVALLDRHGRATAATRRAVESVTAHLPAIGGIIVGAIGVALVVHGAHRWSALHLMS